MTRLHGWRLLLLTCFLLGGCQVFRRPQAPAPAPLPNGQRAVRLMVVQGSDGNTLAFVPVYINGQGPFTFTLDTGASTSTIDVDLARRLGLPEDGSPVQLAGVGSVMEAVPVRVDRWQVGDVKLPAQRLVQVRLPEGDRKSGMQGLLGSDVLSQYGAILVDYRGEMLVLHPKIQLDNP